MPREVLSLILVPLFCLGMACSNGSQVAETGPSDEPPRVVDQLAGSWRLVSWTRQSPSGEIVYPHGPGAFGRIMYQPDGRMMVVLMRRDRPPGSIDEANSERVQEMVVGGFSSYTGRYVLDEQAATVTHHIDASLSPDWVGTQQVRHYRFLSDDRLALRLEPSAEEMAGWETELIWEREE